MGQLMIGNRTAYWRHHLHVLGAIALLPVFVGIYYLSYWLRFEGQLGEGELECFRATAGWVVLVKLAWFVGLQVCQGWRRSVTFYDLVVLLQAATGGLATMALVQVLFTPPPPIPRSVLLLDWGTTIVVLGGARSLLARGPRGPLAAVLLGSPGAGADRRGGRHGAVDAADDPPHRPAALPRRRFPRRRMPNCWEPASRACRCSAPANRRTRLVERHRIRQVWVTQGELTGPQLRKLIDDARHGGCEVRVLPNYRQLIEGSVTVQPRPVSIEDLLQRKPVQLDIEDIRQWIDGRVILVTGSAGSIGSEICRQLLQFAPERIVLVDRAETGQFFLERELQPLAGNNQIDVCIADVLDEARMRRVLMQYRPHVIFHAAAYKHVPLMESHPQEAVRNIVTATRHLADLAMDYHADSFVMISTDKAVNPTSVMGACKRVAELYVQSLADQTRRAGSSPCASATSWIRPAAWCSCSASRSPQAVR